MKKIFFTFIFVFLLQHSFAAQPQEKENLVIDKKSGVSVLKEQFEKVVDCPELTGRVVLPQEPGYNKARLVSNYYTSKNKFPSAVVYCQNTQDVQNAVKWAKCHKKTVRIRSGGHNHEAFSTGNDAIVIDVSEMKQVHVDKDKKMAIIQPGITGGELYSKLYDIGLTQVGGTCSDVGLSGLILTGGLGPLFRHYGLACDSLVAIEIVDAKGNIIEATKNNDYKDLFWASQGGGGGNFGVVTSMAIKVYPANQVTWFNIGWDWSQPVEKIITAWQDFFIKPDKKWFSHLDLWGKAFPTEKLKSQPIKILGVYYGSPEDARRELAPILAIGQPNDQTIELMDWNKAIKAFETATAVFLTDKPEYKSSGAFNMEKLPPEAIKLMAASLENSPYPLFNILIFTMGAVGQDIAPNATAFYYRNAKFLTQYSIQWLDEGDDKIQIREIDGVREKLLAYTKGDYLGNPDRNLKDYLTEYNGENVRRLRCIKRKYDPDNLFQHDQSVPPAPADWKCD